MRLTSLFSCLLAAVFLTGCASYQSPGDTNLLSRTAYSHERSVDDIVFTPGGWPQPLYADLHLPERPGLRPVVVTIHGGGWANRSRADMEDIGEKLVERGYAVFNVSYRFAPEYVFPAQLQDIQHALLWLSKNADAYRLDLARINTWGYSSGAHLAALVAAISEKEPVAQIKASEIPSVRSVVAGGIPADLTVYANSPIVGRFMGGKRDEMLSSYAMASPAHHISADDPPVFLYHGKLDLLVEDEQSKNYYQALKGAGVKAEIYLHNLWGHIAMFLFGRDAENRAMDFLDRQNMST